MKLDFHDPIEKDHTLVPDCSDSDIYVKRLANEKHNFLWFFVLFEGNCCLFYW